MSALAALLPSDAEALTTLVRAALETSLTGFILMRPVYSTEGSALVSDLAYVYLNPAAQQMLRLPECPAESFLTLYPHAVETGIFAFYRDAFLTGEKERYDVNYQHDGLDNYFHLAARRSGELLVVSFDDTATQRRTAVEEALRATQAREQAAAAEAERQRQQLYQTFQEAPAMICVSEGPQHVFQYVNPPYQALVGQQPLVGWPVALAMPELAGQPIFDWLDTVYRTGQTYVANEQLVQLDHDNDQPQQLEKRYYNFIYQARHNAAGAVTGIFTFAYEVTAQVLARQQVQDLNEELAVINEELRASNEEFLSSNAELTHAQQELQQLNQELECRVQSRTHEAEAARAAAERQQRRLEDLFMRAPSAISICEGPDWVYQLVNPGYQQLFSGRSLLGLPILQALPELVGQPVQAILQAVYDTGVPFEGQEVPVQLVRAENGPVEDNYFDLTYQARYDEHGQIDGLITYANDVTQQVLARRELAAQQERLRELLEQAPVAIAVYGGPTYVLDVVNPSMGELLGRSPAELLGKPFAQALPELNGQGIHELLDEVRRTGQPYAVQERAAQLNRHQAGEVGYFSFVYHPLRDAQNQTAAITCVALDVTAQVLARQQVQGLNQELAAINEELQASNEELNKTNHQLTRTNVDLDNFIYTASHDLKQPIANIEGLLTALIYQLPLVARRSELIAPILAHMHDAVERFKRTIGDLTEVSKLQQANAELAQPLDIGEVVRAVQLDLAPVLLEAQGELVVEVEGCPAVLFSEKNLRSVICNLLSNALKYRAPERPLRVRISCAQEGQQVQLRVQDNGLGLDARQQSRLFGLFQRLHTHVEGTGIGLYMVKKMVENAGGTIAVQSQPGVGSTFTVSLAL
ncbi:MAG: PAS domain-containing protein [Janthinobacterium lividum]